MLPTTSVTPEVLKCAADGRPVEIGPEVQALLPGLIFGGYIQVQQVGGVFYPELTATGEVVHPKLTAKGHDLLDTFR